LVEQAPEKLHRIAEFLGSDAQFVPLRRGQSAEPFAAFSHLAPASIEQARGQLTDWRGQQCRPLGRPIAPAARLEPVREAQHSGGIPFRKDGPFDPLVSGFALSVERGCQIIDVGAFAVANVHLSHGQLLNRRQLGARDFVKQDNGAVLLGDEGVADHPRDFRRYQIIYDPWHYLPVLVRKPGALRNGAPFKDWALPPALAQVRAKLKQHADGDQQFVKVLGAVLAHGLSAVEAACAEALAAGIASGDVILTVLARRHQPPTPASITTPDGLRLKVEPVADCGRYDSIRKVA